MTFGDPPRIPDQPDASVETPWLLVAHLVRPQGRKGELLADLHTEHPDRFAENARVFLAPSGFSGPPGAARTAHVTAFWLPKGKSQGRVVLELDISHSISEAEQLAGFDVLVPLSERRALDDDAVYVHDLIGCKVFDGSSEIGTIQDILSIAPASGAAFESESDADSDSDSDSNATPETAPVLVLTNADGVEILVPFAKAYLRSLDLEHRRVDMALPDALLDVYLPAPASQKRKANPSETTG